MFPLSGVGAGKGVGVGSSAQRGAGPSDVLPSPGEGSGPLGTCLLSARLVGRTRLIPAPPEVGPVPHPRSQGTKANLRAGSAPVTNEPPASPCSPSLALTGGCSPEARAGGGRGRGSGEPRAGELLSLLSPGPAESKSFRPGLFMGEPFPAVTNS